jgi:hypothetical protein
MRIVCRTKRWAGLLAAACAAIGVALAGDAPALAAGWPHADPAQPLVQAQRLCAPNIVPINHRCRVIDFTRLGEFGGRDWYYAFYATHWADRHGRIDRGFPVFLYLQGPATLRLGLWINDAPGLAGRWALTPPSRPVIIADGEETYLGVTLKNVGEAPDQRLFRLRDIRWRTIKVLERSTKDQAMIDAATPEACSIADDGIYDWRALTVSLPLRNDLTGQPCGRLIAQLAVHGERTAMTEVRLQH